MKLPWVKEEEKDPTSEEGGTGTKPDEEADPKKKELSTETPPTDTGAQSPFNKDGPLAGMSEKEVVDRIALQDMTITEQKAVVDGVEPRQVVAPEPEPEPVNITSEAFFLDPAKAIRDVTSETIQRELKEIVAELRTDMAVGRAKTSWDEALESIPNLSTMRPLIEAKLKQSGIQSPNIATIIGFNDMLVGEAERKGTPLPRVETRAEIKGGETLENTRTIPQHSASTQPLASETKKEEFEPLDENESRLARERGMTHLQYRQWQEVDIADVTKPVPEKVS